MRKGIANTEYYPSPEIIEKKSALLLTTMNKHMSALRDYHKRYSNLADTCKAEEVERLLGISKREVWLKASKGELTPCLQLTNQTMYATKGLNPIGLVSIDGLFTLSKGAISDWFARGTGTFSTSIFFPVRLDYISDESWMGNLALPLDSLEPPRFLWKDAPLEAADKFQMAVTVGEPTDRTIPLDDFLYLREQVNSLISEDARLEDKRKKEDRFKVFRDMKLMPNEVTLDLAPGKILVIEAKDKTKRVTFGEFNLIDGRNGKLNKEANLLIDLGAEKPIRKKNTKERAAYYSAIKGIKRLFKAKLGINSDPFAKDWKPHFKVKDSTGRADLRAKQIALRWQKALKKQQKARSEQRNDGNDDSYDPSDSEQISTSKQSDDGSPEINLTALVDERLASGIIPQDQHEQFVRDVKAGKKTSDEYVEWIKTFQ